MYENIILELESLQSVYSEEGVTDGSASIVNVPAHSLQSKPAVLTVKPDPASKKTKQKQPELDNTPVEVVETVIVLRPMTGMQESKVAVSVHLKLFFQTKVSKTY